MCIRDSHCDDSEGSLVLRHSQFASGIYEEECNGGEVVAHAIDVNNSMFTSQLRLTANPDLEMNDKTVECAYDNGTTVSVIDTAMVIFAALAGISTTACTHVMLAISRSYVCIYVAYM